MKYIGEGGGVRTHYEPPNFWLQFHPRGWGITLHYIFAWALGVFACRRNNVPGPEGNSLIDVAEQPP